MLCGAHKPVHLSVLYISPDDNKHALKNRNKTHLISIQVTGLVQSVIIIYLIVFIKATTLVFKYSLVNDLLQRKKRRR